MSDSLFGLGNLITDSGRARFSGPSTGIPTQDLVDSLVEPQQQRIDRIETQVEDNNFKIDALENLRSRFEELRSAAGRLNGRRTIAGSNSAFAEKALGNATTSRFDNQQPSEAADIIGAQLTNQAQVRDHQIEVLQRAEAEQLGSSIFSRADEALADGDDAEVSDGSFNGAFTIGTQTLTSTSVGDPTDTLANQNLASGTLDLTVNGTTRSFDTSTASLNDVAADIDGNVANVSAQVNGDNQLELSSDNGDPITLSDGGSEFLENTDLQGASTISTADSDSLNDVRDKINSADAGVTASVVNISDTEKQLVLAAEDTGTDNRIALADTTNNPLEDLGVLDGSGNKQSVIQDAQNARFTADNVKEQTTAQSERVNDTSQSLLNLGLVEENSNFTLSVTNNDGTTDIEVPDGSGSIDVDATSLEDLATAINDQTPASITAGTVDTNGDGQNDSLEVNSSNGSLSFSDGGSTFLENTNLDDEIFERQSNTVDDVFQGVTLNIRQAEDGTTVNLPVERDLAAAREDIQSFVDAFNSVQRFVNAQRQEVQLEGQSEDTVGALADERVLDSIQQRLNQISSGVGRNVDGEFSTLRSIGIQELQDDEIADPLNRGTLTVRDSLDENDPAVLLDTALSQNFEDVRNLFQFDFRTSNPSAQLLNFTGNTGAVENFDLNVSTDGNGTITDADLNGDASLVEIASDNSVRVTDGEAQGLSVFFNEPNVTNETINFDTGVGIGAQTFFTAQNAASERDSGLIQSTIDSLESQNENRNERLDRLERQLDDRRETLIQRFSELEGNIAQLGQQQQILQARLGGGN
ncbi:Flagellin hook IN motif-containing protein [Limimonas halophila]|uniref:Flagellar hook-associated protein 2 n=1 Tax=Limimonas halophila TaxID=1082479 RepID=A0A1G7Q2Z3_9PROT|nr:flagellar filament capping protein FliD [Limimonas halophila]SDF92845.1 Flagellin hook IN motif-containing protein [Limimonas halophila]